jgi:energy-coupling factor transporter ATP-binding protein EcfA2
VQRRRERPSRTQIAARVAELLDLMQLSGFGKRFPAQLSGGQRQRVALARALAVDPKVLLLDEPFGALDAKVRGELREWLHGLQRQLGLTTIFVTHDQHEAFQLADRVAILNGGRLEQVGSAAEIQKWPASPFVIGFIGADRSAADRTVVGSVFTCQCGEDSEVSWNLARPPATQPRSSLAEARAEEVAGSLVDLKSANFDQPIWTPRMAAPVISALSPPGADLPPVAAGELWLLAVATSEATPFEGRALPSANVIIYDRPLRDWVAALLPLGGYAEPATGDAVARCIQFVRDGWSVLRLIERSTDADVPANDVQVFAEWLRLAGAPEDLRVRPITSDQRDTPASEIRLEDVSGSELISGRRVTAVVFDAFAIAGAARLAIMANGLAG